MPDKARNDDVCVYTDNPTAIEAIGAGNLVSWAALFLFFGRGADVANSVDVLFVDEAGANVVANVRAVSQADPQVILLEIPALDHRCRDRIGRPRRIGSSPSPRRVARRFAPDQGLMFKKTTWK